VKHLVIWGASGHAKVIAQTLSPEQYDIIGFIDKDPNITTFFDREVSHSMEDLVMKKSLAAETGFIIAIGGDKGQDRMEIHRELVAHGLYPFTFIHPKAWVAPSAQISAGAQILGMAAISSDVKIGMQTIVNTNATVDHETTIGEGCHVMPAATITGCCVVQNHCTIGANATILPRLTLARHTYVGAGAVVTKNTNPHTTVVGVPARER